MIREARVWPSRFINNINSISSVFAKKKFYLLTDMIAALQWLWFQSSGSLWRQWVFLTRKHTTFTEDGATLGVTRSHETSVVQFDGAEVQNPRKHTGDDKVNAVNLSSSECG